MRSTIPAVGDNVEVFNNEGELSDYYKSDEGLPSEVVSVFLNKRGYLMTVLEQENGSCVCIAAHYVRPIKP